MVAGGPDGRGKRRREPESWSVIRRRIFYRDFKRCQACGDELTERNYWCGHVVDRIIGGSDEDGNLVTMCAICEDLKPLHESRAEFDAWVASGVHLDPTARDQAFGDAVRQLLRKFDRDRARKPKRAAR